MERKPSERGPCTAEGLPPEGRYELSQGYPIYCAPSGPRHGGSKATGVLPLSTDPLVHESGVDVGYSDGDRTVRAPDVSVGNVPDQPGWARGAPPLTVEYADTGTDEAELRQKIAELLSAGTQQVWVVRLWGPRRVEVHRAGSASVAVRAAGQQLEAPGVLANPLPVEALYDRGAAFEATLRNLLQRRGYASLDAVLDEGARQGQTLAMREGLGDLCEALGVELTSARRAALASLDLDGLITLRAALKQHGRWPG